MNKRIFHFLCLVTVLALTACAGGDEPQDFNIFPQLAGSEWEVDEITTDAGFSTTTHFTLRFVDAHQVKYIHTDEAAGSETWMLTYTLSGNGLRFNGYYNGWFTAMSVTSDYLSLEEADHKENATKKTLVMRKRPSSF